LYGKAVVQFFAPQLFGDKRMEIFCMDLDNTIIYSYKHDIGPDKRSVEIYQGREISYITERTYGLLKEVNKKMTLIPTSTRTEQQYKRIDLGIGGFKYALVCNGGLLLVDGVRDAAWYETSLQLIEPSKAELENVFRLLEKDQRRKFELRFIENLFLFTKCSNPEEVVDELKEQLDGSLVDVFNNGEKVYAVPLSLSKGNALRRLRKLLNPKQIIAAGDSEFDISLVEEADYGIVPHCFKKRYGIDSNVHQMGEDKIFSEAVLEEIIKQTGRG